MLTPIDGTTLKIFNHLSGAVVDSVPLPTLQIKMHGIPDRPDDGDATRCAQVRLNAMQSCCSLPRPQQSDCEDAIVHGSGCPQ